MDTQEQQRREGYKMIASRWMDRFYKRVDALAEKEDLSIDDLAEATWESMMDRVTPKDSSEMEARKALGKDVWEKGADDPELYWRILYNLAWDNYAQETSQSLSPSKYSAVLPVRTVVAVTRSPHGREHVFRLGKEIGQDNIAIPISNKMADFARQNLSRLGADGNTPLIPLASRGMYKGVPVKVESYTPDGCIYFATESERDYMRLGKANNWSSSVSPSELNPSDFHLPDPCFTFDTHFTAEKFHLGTVLRDLQREFSDRGIRVPKGENSIASRLGEILREHSGEAVTLRLTNDPQQGWNLVVIDEIEEK